MDPRRALYPKSLRLRRRGAFRRVLAAGTVHPGQEVLVRRCPNRHGGPRLGIATPRRYGKAVRRNRLRRLTREAFRLLQHDLGPYDYLVSPRRHLVRPTLIGVQADLRACLGERP